MKFEPGIKTGISYAEYDTIPALRSHVLIDMKKSPAHARYNIENPSDNKDAYVFGEAVHCAVLEPDRFLKEYIRRPDASQCDWAGANKNSNKYKDGYAAWALDHDEKVILTPREFRECCALRDSAHKHPLANKLLNGLGHNEVVAMWRDPGTEIPCKARIDRLTTHNGHTVIIDVKTARDASPWKFGYDAGKYNYHLQLSFYRRGLNVLDARPRKCYLIVLEKSPPWCCAIYEIDREALDISESTMQNMIYKYADCENTGIWPGYGTDVSRLQLPKYTYYEEAE